MGIVPWHYDTLYLFSPYKDVIKNKFHFYVLAQAEKAEKIHGPYELATPGTLYQLTATSYQLPVIP